MSVDAALQYLKSFELQALRSTITGARQRTDDETAANAIEAAYATITIELNAAIEEETPPEINPTEEPQTKPA